MAVALSAPLVWDAFLAEHRLIDMIFGTWNNPKTAPKEAGFYDGASSELRALLVGKKLA